MLRECSNLGETVLSKRLYTIFSGYKSSEGDHIGNEFLLRDDCEYHAFLFKLSILNDRLCMTISILAEIYAKANSDDYINAFGGWFSKLFKIINIDQKLFKDTDVISFFPISRLTLPDDGVSTASFILCSDGWVAYSQASNRDLNGEVLQIKEILVPSIEYGFQDIVEQKKNSAIISINYIHFLIIINHLLIRR